MALIQIVLGLIKPVIPSFRVITFRGMDIFDIISRIFSILVTIFIMTFGIINTIAADFIKSHGVLKIQGSNYDCQT